MDAIGSFFSNIKDKITNPFFGTLIIVLLFQHWELWFAVFNFDKDCTLTDRIYIMQNYISQNITLKTFLYDLLYAFGLMLFGYLIVVLTRSIVIFIEHKVMPLITNSIVSKNVVLKNIYDEVVKERDENFDQYEEQRKNVREFSKTIDEQLKQIKEKDRTITNTLEDISLVKKGIQEKENEISSLLLNEEKNTKIIAKLEIKNNFISRMYEIYEKILFQDKAKEFYGNTNNVNNIFPPLVVNTHSKLINDNQLKIFNDFANYIKSDRNMILNPNIHLDYFEELELIYIQNQNQTLEYFLTPLGKIVHDYGYNIGV